MANTPTREWHNSPFPLWRPSDNNLIGANFAPRHLGTAIALLTGVYLLHRIRVPAGKDITNIIINVTSAGVGNTYGAAAVYETDGTRAGVTGSQVTPWSTTGLKTMALGTPIAAKDYDRNVWIGITVGGGSAAPILSGQSSQGQDLGLPNPGRLNAGYIFGSSPLPATMSLDLMTSYYECWVGLS